MAAQATQLPPLPFRKVTLRKKSMLPLFAAGAALGDQYARELDSKGYLAGLVLVIGGTETSAVADPGAHEDFPWKLFNLIEIRDSAGSMLARMSGFNAHLAAKYFAPQRRGTVDGSGAADIYAVNIAPLAANNIRFDLPIWVETNARDNVGLVPNQNAAFKYNLVVNYEPEANVVTTPANATWAVTMQPVYHYYTVPAATRPEGRTQEIAPPFIGAIRQQWDEQILSGFSNGTEVPVKLQPGRVIRNLCLVGRTAATTGRVNGIDRVKFFYGDDQQLFDVTGQELRSESRRLFGIDPPTGVYPILFTDDSAGYVGSDYRRDIIDSRMLSQVYLLVTTSGGLTALSIVHDEVIVPVGMNL